jgi:hypothetical protein
VPCLPSPLLQTQQSQSPLQAAAQSLLDNPAFSGTAVDAARLLGEEGAALAAAGPPRPDDLGLPVMELFLRRVEDPSDADGAGGAEGAGPSVRSGHRYEQQAVALYAPDAALMDAQEEQESVASTLAEFIATGAWPCRQQAAWCVFVHVWRGVVPMPMCAGMEWFAGLSCSKV